jgi:hypothetical protein
MSITSYTDGCQKLLKRNRRVTKIKIKDKKNASFLKCKILTHFSANPFVAMTLWA